MRSYGSTRRVDSRRIASITFSMALLDQLQAAIGDRYLIERELARGGMATIYVATDRRHGRSLALKVMDSTVTGPLGAARFLREIEIAARLTHPHIVPLYDSGEARLHDDGEPVLYYVMPFIAGESLRNRLGRDGALPLADVARIVREVAGALDYAHRQGVVHRDIKPENILISERHAVVADFGIARAVAEASTGTTITQIGMMVGTPAYVSPEQATGGEVDGRSDQYALACVVYELLTGQTPFAGSNTMALLSQHMTADPPPLRAREAVPEAVEAALRRALSKDPADRFATVGAFADAFTVSEADAPTSAVRLPGSAPPQRSPRLPVPLTPLVGRETDVRTVAALLQRDSLRLLTLHGPGGIGKTRVAIEVASHAAEIFPDGIYYVALTDARDADLLHSRIAQAVGLRGGAVGSRDTLRDQLRDRAALLVLDNFEQLVEHASDVTSLLADCPRLKALVTSQVLLRVYGEHEYPIGPLPLPELHTTQTPSTVGASAAVRLFVERAIAARADFQLDAENSSAVAEICVRVDGVPLAIELAAARIRTSTPQALLPKLRQALDVLTGGARDLPARQRTMRAAIAWCHDMLDTGERTLFRRLSVFRGGLTPAAAAAVCIGDPAALAEAEDALQSLVDHSLLRQYLDHAGTQRYRMLRPIEAFADESLEAAGEPGTMRERHAAYFMRVAEDHEQRVADGNEIALDLLEAEQDNLLASLDHLLSREAAGDALRMSLGLWRFWEARSYAREGLERMRAILDTSGSDLPLKLRLSGLYAAGILADTVGDYALGRRLFEQHLALTEQLGEPRATSVARNNLAVLLVRQGDVDAAIVHFQAAVDALLDIDPRGAAVGIANIGNAERLRGNFAAARAHYDRAMGAFRDGNDHANVAWTLSHLGDVARDEGDLVQARLRYRESLAGFMELRHGRGTASVLTEIAELTAGQGNFLESRSLLQEALVHAADVGDQRAMVRVFEVLAGVFAAAGRDHEAVRLGGAVAGLRDRLGAPLSEADRDRIERRLAAAVERLGQLPAEQAWCDGLSMSMEEAVRFATSSENV